MGNLTEKPGSREKNRSYIILGHELCTLLQEMFLMVDISDIYSAFAPKMSLLGLFMECILLLVSPLAVEIRKLYNESNTGMLKH